MKIYHNPRCTKSRETLALLNGLTNDFEIVEYLNNVPTVEELKALLEKLGMRASELIRKSEAVYKELYKGKDLTEEQWLDAMVSHPKLIERPIVVKGNKAVIGRPPENIKSLF